MPLPTKNDVRAVDPVLTNLSIGFKNDAFLADQIAPFKEVGEQSGTYYIYTKDYWFRRATGANRASSAPYTRLDYGVESSTYKAKEYGFEKALDDPTKKASQTPENLETQDTAFITNQIQIEIEMQVAAAAFVTGVYTSETTLTGTNQWSDYSNSEPISDVDTACETIKQLTGMKANVGFIGAAAWRKLKEHPLITEKYKYTQKGIMTPELVAAVLGLDEIIVGNSIYNTAVEGQTFSGSYIWGDNMLIMVRQAPGLLQPTAASTLIWNEKGNYPWGVETYRDEPVRADVQRCFSHWDIKILAADLGYLIIDTNA